LTDKGSIYTYSTEPAEIVVPADPNINNTYILEADSGEDTGLVWKLLGNVENSPPWVTTTANPINIDMAMGIGATVYCKVPEGGRVVIQDSETPPNTTVLFPPRPDSVPLRAGIYRSPLICSSSSLTITLEDDDDQRYLDNVQATDSISTDGDVPGLYSWINETKKELSNFSITSCNTSYDYLLTADPSNAGYKLYKTLLNSLIQGPFDTLYYFGGYNVRKNCQSSQILFDKGNTAVMFTESPSQSSGYTGIYIRVSDSDPIRLHTLYTHNYSSPDLTSTGHVCNSFTFMCNEFGEPYSNFDVYPPLRKYTFYITESGESKVTHIDGFDLVSADPDLNMDFPFYFTDALTLDEQTRCTHLLRSSATDSTNYNTTVEYLVRDWTNNSLTKYDLASILESSAIYDINEKVISTVFSDDRYSLLVSSIRTTDNYICVTKVRLEEKCRANLIDDSTYIKLPYINPNLVDNDTSLTCPIEMIQLVGEKYTEGTYADRILEKLTLHVTYRASNGDDVRLNSITISPPPNPVVGGNYVIYRESVGGVL